MKSGKRIVLAALILSVVTVMTGCVKAELGLILDKNGKADVTMVYALHESMSSFMEDDFSILTVEDLQKYETDGWKAEEFSGGGYNGYRLTKNGVDLLDEELFHGEGTSLKKEKSYFILDIPMDYDRENLATMETLGIVRESGGTITVRVTLPVKPEKHNATSVSEDGKTLTWDLLSPGTGQVVHAEYKIPSFPFIPLLIALLVILLIVFLFLAVRKRNEEMKRKREMARERRLKRMREEQERNSVQSLDHEFTQDRRAYLDDDYGPEYQEYPEDGYASEDPEYPDDSYVPEDRGYMDNGTDQSIYNGR